MKGLLLKDFYMLTKYCRWYLLVALIFILVFAVGKDSLFFGFYPCLLTGMIPVTLMAYDERSKWDMYCKGLPYTGAEIVSAKYLVGLCCQLFVMILTGIALAVRMNMAGKFDLEEYLYFLLLSETVSCAASSLMLPFLFKFGSEKGRMAYYCVIGIVLSGAAVAANLLRGGGSRAEMHTWIAPVICIAAIAVYALSWCLSVSFYKKREG